MRDMARSTGRISQVVTCVSSIRGSEEHVFVLTWWTADSTSNKFNEPGSPPSLLTLAASVADCVMSRSGVRPSVCLVGILTVTHQGAAYDATSVHFGPTIRRTDTRRFFAENRYGGCGRRSAACLKTHDCASPSKLATSSGQSGSTVVRKPM